MENINTNTLIMSYLQHDPRVPIMPSVIESEVAGLNSYIYIYIYIYIVGFFTTT